MGATRNARRAGSGALSQFALRHQSDERLVALARAGSDRAFDEIIQRYERPLISYCGRVLGPDRAADAVQQAFLQAFLALSQDDLRDMTLRPWLYRIAHNCSIDILRKNGWDYDELDLNFDGVPQPPQLFEQKEELGDLVRAMRDLPERQRQALVLRELEGRSYQEIATELGHTASSIRQLIFRARTTLRKALRNSLGMLVPFGWLRSLLEKQSVPATADPYQTVAATISTASAGGGLVKAGTVLLTSWSLIAGGAVTGIRSGDSRAARPAPPAAVGTSGAAVSPQVFSESRAEPAAETVAPVAQGGHRRAGPPAAIGETELSTPAVMPEAVAPSPAPLTPAPAADAPEAGSNVGPTPTSEQQPSSAEGAGSSGSTAGSPSAGTDLRPKPSGKDSTPAKPPHSGGEPPGSGKGSPPASKGDPPGPPTKGPVTKGPATKGPATKGPTAGKGPGVSPPALGVAPAAGKGPAGAVKGPQGGKGSVPGKAGVPKATAPKAPTSL